MTPQEIESIIFEEVGLGKYKLKKFEFNPSYNSNGTLKIGNDYYVKIYPSELNNNLIGLRDKTTKIHKFNNPVMTNECFVIGVDPIKITNYEAI